MSCAQNPGKRILALPGWRARPSGPFTATGHAKPLSLSTNASRRRRKSARFFSAASGIATLEAANRYLVEHFLPVHNATFACAPRDPASAFVPLGSVDLDPILCREDARVVARDNTVTIRGHVLQVAAQTGRRSCAGLRVYVREHLDGRFTITRGARHFGTFTAAGPPVRATRGSDARPRAPRLGGKRTARHRG